MKIGIHCYLIAGILPKLLQKGSLSGPLPNIVYTTDYHMLYMYHYTVPKHKYKNRLMNTRLENTIHIKNVTKCMKHAYITLQLMGRINRMITTRMIKIIY